jgi:hypothetical protein
MLNHARRRASRMSALAHFADSSRTSPEVREVPCMDGARDAREESDVSANRSGAAMYPAFECSRYGRRP